MKEEEKLRELYNDAVLKIKVAYQKEKEQLGKKKMYDKGIDEVYLKEIT